MERVATDWRTAGLSPADKGLAEWAVAVTVDPSGMRAEAITRLRNMGFSDRAIHDAAQVVSYFNYINRMADALGVDEEAWLRRWEDGAADRRDETPSC